MTSDRLNLEAEKEMSRLFLRLVLSQWLGGGAIPLKHPKDHQILWKMDRGRGGKTIPPDLKILTFGSF